MVSLAEFIEHLLVSAAVMGLGVGVVALIRFRFDVGHDFFRRLLFGYAGSIALIAVLSVSSNVTERRCQRNPLEFCRYNDNVPFMALVVFVFVTTCGVRAFFLHFNR